MWYELGWKAFWKLKSPFKWGRVMIAEGGALWAVAPELKAELGPATKLSNWYNWRGGMGRDRGRQHVESQQDLRT